MTCIIGYIDKDGNVYVGADSCASNGYVKRSRNDQKIWENDGYLMANTGSPRVGQLLAHAFNPPHPKADEDLMRFMVTTFIDSVRECLSSGGIAKKEHEVETGGTFLVAYKGRLFTIFEDYQVAESCNNYTAAGSGEEIAMGALFALEDNKMCPVDKVSVALRAAAEFNCYVQGPMIIRRLGDGGITP